MSGDINTRILFEYLKNLIDNFIIIIKTIFFDTKNNKWHQFFNCVLL